MASLFPSLGVVKRPFGGVMSSRITLVSHAPTPATNRGAFSADESLDTRGIRWAEDARARIPRASRALSAPAPSCRQTALALGLDATLEPALADWDLGRWRGRTLDDVAAGDPDAVAAWLTDPAAVPHGGETHLTLLDRISCWLGSVPDDGHTVAVTHAAVVRAAVLAVLQASPAGFWRIDIAPLTATELRGRPGRWTIRSTAVPLRPNPAS